MARIQKIVGCMIVAGGATLAPGSAVAQAQLGPYLAFGGGLDQMPDRDLVISGRSVNSQWKPGWGGFAAIG